MIEVRQPGRKPLYVAVRGDLELGRDCDGLLLVDEEVSRRHAVFTPDGNGLTVNDLGSTNGTFVDGTRVSTPTPVAGSSTVRMGGTEVRLVGDVADPRGTVATPMSAGERGTVAPTSEGRRVTPSAPMSNELRGTSIELVAAAVEHEKPDVRGLAGDGDTVTIVFSDIESSTERAMALGDQRWFTVLGVHNDLVRKRLNEFGGREIKSQGDGFMLTFPSARRAVQCCIAIQEDLASYEVEDPETGVRVRMGVHTGEAIVDAGGDLFGKHIIVAARIANLAHGGQILASGVTAEITSSRGDLHFGPPEDVELKGIGGTYQVRTVEWQRPEG
jgi:class 3 adenylate cyclase